ncbi:hypothetical protein LT85_3936 [Collimonas arenae]|uniref:Uncharacterized protein n=1 Tax=Collimonas arenae TaxID=279058 RepID=A0A0A1FHH8_9BURK|nr:hypothetical protein LT85_3936 [Collimonas arenae]
MYVVPLETEGKHSIAGLKRVALFLPFATQFASDRRLPVRFKADAAGANQVAAFGGDSKLVFGSGMFEMLSDEELKQSVRFLNRNILVAIEARKFLVAPQGSVSVSIVLRKIA